VKSIPYIATLPDGSVRLEFPYNAVFIRRLKDEVPAHARSYDPEAKAWFVDVPYAPRIIALFRRTFPDAHIDQDEPARPEPNRERGITTMYGTLCLTAEAPPELVASAYRILAKLHHPDRGGNDERMRQINAAYRQIGAV